MEQENDATLPQTKRTVFLALIGIVMVALNLRVAAVAASPIYGIIAKTFPISNTWHGIMGMLPLLCFGVFGLFSPWINRKIGLEKGLILSMLMITVGEAARGGLSHSIYFFAASSILSMGGMGIGNVLILPAIKHYFPKRIGLITGVYLVLIAVSAAIPSAIAVPVTHSMGWRFSLGIWSVLALLAALPWFWLIHAPVQADQKNKSTDYKVWKWPVSWAIAMVFSVGALVMYALIAWLPSILITSAGKSAVTAGIMLSVYNLSGLPHSLIIPIVLTRMKKPYLIVLLGSICIITGVLGLAYLPSSSWIWIFPAGLGAMLVPVGLTFVSMRSRTEEGTTALSGFVQSVGYLIASIGPLLVGTLHSSSAGWILPCYFMAITAVIAAIAGIIAVRPVFIEDMNKK